MARRQPYRIWPRSLRRAGRMAALWAVSAIILINCSAAAQTSGSASRSQPGSLVSAEYTGPTTRYSHGVLGDEVEWSGLSLTIATGEGATRSVSIELPADHVFEDLQPRLVDLTGDGRLDAAMVVETDMARGAALALYDAEGKIAETPHIGQTNRWLAPVGAADLDGDGHVELAYIDRPHLARTLRIWRYSNGALHEVASLPGLTNHRIGQDFISSGIRTCGAGPEIVTVNANWSRIVVARLTVAGIATEDAGVYSGTESIKDALNCK